MANKIDWNATPHVIEDSFLKKQIVETRATEYGIELNKALDVYVDGSGFPYPGSTPLEQKKDAAFDAFVNGGFDGPSPDVIANESGIEPCGHRIVVRVDEVERQTESGIILREDTADREEMSGTKATVVAVGPSAWADQKIGGQWAKVGDRVMIAKFAGQLWKRANVKYRVISDLDVIAVIRAED